MTAFDVGYNLNLFSNFTYFLDDPIHGDQFHQFDHRFITGGKINHQRLGHWLGHEVQNTIGVQLRTDAIATVGLYHTEARQLLDTFRPDSVMETSAAVSAHNETQSAPWHERSRVSALTAIGSALTPAIPRTAARDVKGLPAQRAVR